MAAFQRTPHSTEGKISSVLNDQLVLKLSEQAIPLKSETSTILVNTTIKIVFEIDALPRTVAIVTRVDALP